MSLVIWKSRVDTNPSLTTSLGKDKSVLGYNFERWSDSNEIDQIKYKTIYVGMGSITSVLSKSGSSI